MAIILIVFGLVFLIRDAQVLALRDGVSVTRRLVAYGTLQFAAIVLVTSLGVGTGSWRAWTDRRFALTCVVIQAAEFGVAWLLGKVAGGRFNWVGWMLPSPVFVVALLGLRFALERGLLLSPMAAIQMAILLWLLLVSLTAMLLSRVGGEREDTAFAGDFALVTNCAALIFVPIGFF
jgi:hypothetical protein